MAVPTITSCTPATGATIGGYLLRVSGTGFRLPPTPPAEGYIGGPAPVTVRVLVGGVQTANVRVWSAGLLDCLVPEYTGAPLAANAAQDVQVLNLDNSGAPIAGETVTATAAFAYTPNALVEKTRLDWANRKLTRMFGRHVLANVVWRTHPDFDDDVADLKDTLAQAKLPVLELSGPRMERNRFYSRTERDYQPPVGERSERKEIPLTADLIYRIRILTENPAQLYNLVQGLLLVVERALVLPVPADPADEAGLNDPWELVWDELPAISSLDERLHSADASVRVVGFDILEQDRFVTGAYRLPDDPVLDAQAIPRA